MVRHFMEYRFRWSAPGAAKSFGLEAEYNDASGTDNSVVRGGATWRFNVPILKRSWLQFRILPVQSRGEASQFSIIHKLHLANRVSLIGFSDLNVPWDGGPSRVVAESQLTYHLSPAIGIGIEARYNGFEDANENLDGIGIGFALMATL